MSYIGKACNNYYQVYFYEWSNLTELFECLSCRVILWHCFWWQNLGSWRGCGRRGMASETWIFVWFCWRWSALINMGCSISICYQAISSCSCTSEWGKTIRILDNLSWYMTVILENINALKHVACCFFALVLLMDLFFINEILLWFVLFLLILLLYSC